ncbi:uncharacterized protein FA14DRAFT_153902 [Meira miltonrushii]|uniref:Uncharacterized protein n=1 Tax=Meira miltonrushii TaxID=1280837 RepID=A0A316VQY2_9BASI|nr:uncharacterized protein FA14DRAFT_153902 [Meira miltonrushii]PWN38581.1 hypothetical protein FA14DRAFT_153902 [Meira miltonrushii]
MMIIWVTWILLHFVSFCTVAQAVSTLASHSGSSESNDITGIHSSEDRINVVQPERVEMDKERLRRFKRMIYQRNYRKKYPERVKASNAKFQDKRNNDPIRREHRRLYKAEYAKKHRRPWPKERAQEKTEQQLANQTNSEAVLPRGKRKRIDSEDESKAQTTRVRTYGRPPMSSAFLNHRASETGNHIETERAAVRSGHSLQSKSPPNLERTVPETHKFNLPNARERFRLPPRKGKKVDLHSDQSS